MFLWDKISCLSSRYRGHTAVKWFSSSTLFSKWRQQRSSAVVGLGRLFRPRSISRSCPLTLIWAMHFLSFEPSPYFIYFSILSRRRYVDVLLIGSPLIGLPLACCARISGRFLKYGSGDCYSVAHSQKAVSTHFTSKLILPFGIAEQYWRQGLSSKK